MGACEFHEYAVGRSANEAFRSAQDEARHWNGHGGYTGTIAEVGDYHIYEIAKGVRLTAMQLVRAAWDSYVYVEYDKKLDDWVFPPRDRKQKEAHDKLVRAFGNKAGQFFEDVTGSKWEPCAAILVRGKERTEVVDRMFPYSKGKHGQNVYLFAGMASE